jgi:hypothetical protein
MLHNQNNVFTFTALTGTLAFPLFYFTINNNIYQPDQTSKTILFLLKIYYPKKIKIN